MCAVELFGKRSLKIQKMMKNAKIGNLNNLKIEV